MYTFKSLYRVMALLVKSEHKKDSEISAKRALPSCDLAPSLMISEALSKFEFTFPLERF